MGSIFNYFSVKSALIPLAIFYDNKILLHTFEKFSWNLNARKKIKCVEKLLKTRLPDCTW